MDWYKSIREDYHQPGLENFTRLTGDQEKIMCCHKHDENDNPTPCVGWLMNQAGEGNNINVRLRLQFTPNAGDLKLLGEQRKDIFSFFGEGE